MKSPSGCSSPARENPANGLARTGTGGVRGAMTPIAAGASSPTTSAFEAGAASGWQQDIGADMVPAAELQGAAGTCFAIIGQ